MTHAVVQVLTPQQFRKVEDDNDIFNHSNRHFWEASSLLTLSPASSEVWLAKRCLGLQMVSCCSSSLHWHQARGSSNSYFNQ